MSLLQKFFKCVGSGSGRYEWFYTFIDSKFTASQQLPVLFIDLGANIGQGFEWFSDFYSGKNIDFHLFEPSPNCILHLNEISIKSNKKISIFNSGVGIEEGIFKFYGLASHQGGELSQGGSIMPQHNSQFYNSKKDDSIDVSIIDFSKYLREQKKQYHQIIVKMDIEGAEIELLEKLIADHSISLISIIYIEFHAKNQIEEHKKLTEKRELSIISSLSRSNTKFRVWR